ncbi:MAG: S1C family serine protease [Xanthobacteraceae bacterium]
MRTAYRLGGPALAAGLVVALCQSAAAEIRLSVDQVIGKTRGWTIGYSNSLGGCVAIASYRDQTTVWFGIGRDLGPYIAFTNPRWDRVAPGERYTLRLGMGRQGSWRGAFTGVEHGNEKGFITTGVKAQFFGDFARAGGITVAHDRNSLTRLNLSGSRAALEDLIACERARPRVASPSSPSGPRSSAQPAARSKEKGQSFGTGFYVSSRGHVLTNHHVINGCTTFRVNQGAAFTEAARVIASDAKNDLALLTTDLKPAAVPAMRMGVKVGEGISVYGFPLAGLLASTGNFTTGTVTANAGLADDTRMLQISAPVQPGNSGGPLVDRHGNVVGVIVSKLNALSVAQVTKDLPQNINFAIKSVIAASFLESNDVSAPTATSTTVLDTPQIAERAKAFTVRISCK